MQTNKANKNRDIYTNAAMRAQLPAMFAIARSENPAIDGYIGHAKGIMYFQQFGNPMLTAIDMPAAFAAVLPDYAK